MILRLLRRASDDRSGGAAIEFALIFPAIFVLNVGATEALEAYEAQRNVAHIAAAVADITAQSRSVTTSELNDVLSAGVSMIHPFPLTGLQARVSSISSSPQTGVGTDWTQNRNYAGGDSPSVPSGYLQTGESVIVADVIYDYKPTFGLFLPDTIRFTRHAYSRPRLSPKVEKVG